MRGRIIRRVSAKRDLLENFVNIAARSAAAAHRFLHAAEKTFQLLSAQPAIGKRTDFSHPAVREARRFPIKDFENYLNFLPAYLPRR